MPRLEELENWLEATFDDQGAAAKKIGTTQGTISKWINGKQGISKEYRKKLEKLHYNGPYEIILGAGVGITRAEFDELKAALKAHIEYWRDGEERVLKRLAGLDQKLARLEKQAGISD